MSTNERPGMAINEDEIERHVRETRQQAERANYPTQPTRLHEKAEPAPPKSRASSRGRGGLRRRASR